MNIDTDDVQKLIASFKKYKTLYDTYVTSLDETYNSVELKTLGFALHEYEKFVNKEILTETFIGYVINMNPTNDIKYCHNCNNRHSINKLFAFIIDKLNVCCDKCLSDTASITSEVVSSTGVNLIYRNYKQMQFIDKVLSIDWTSDSAIFDKNIEKYKYFMSLKATDNYMIPTFEIDLIWHSHMNKKSYKDDCVKLLGKVISHDDTISESVLMPRYIKSCVKWSTTHKEKYGDIDVSNIILLNDLIKKISEDDKKILEQYYPEVKSIIEEEELYNRCLKRLRSYWPECG